VKKLNDKTVVSLTGPLKVAIQEGAITQEQFVRELQELNAVGKEMRRVPAPIRAEAYHEVLDKYLSDTFAKPKPEMVPTCKRGCSHCCYQNVDVIWDEASLLLESHSDKIDWTRFEAQLNAEDHRKLPHEMKACIFLKDGQCSVYADRPNSCRKYFVISEPEKCDSQKYPGGEVGTVYSYRSELFASALMTLQDSGSMTKMITKVLEKKK
jgi:Fe-S-cluster containining protein